MNRLQYLLIFFLFILIFLNCRKSDSLSIIPKIEFIGVSKKQMRQGAGNIDSLWLQFKFEDGDGDLGHTSPDTTKDIILMDSRTGIVQDRYRLPDLPPSQNDPQQGTITILVYTTCCFFPDPTISPCMKPPQYPFDSLKYQIYIVDRAGHPSNVIQSEFVRLSCQ